ncbi:MAG: TatD family hydrolase, partial [Anaerolineales bacterium]
LFMALQQLLPHPKIVAIGEIGLDYYRQRNNPEVQKAIFKRQLEIASDMGLPVIIHNRDATQDVVKMVREWSQSQKDRYEGYPLGVFHAFSENLDWAKQIVDLGFLIGVGGVLTYPKSTLLREVVNQIPIEKIVIETDAPFLPPQPYRGKTNEPAYLTVVVTELTKIKNLDKETMIKLINQNSRNLFGIN